MLLSCLVVIGALIGGSLCNIARELRSIREALAAGPVVEQEVE